LSLFRIFDWHVAVVAVLTLAATWLCMAGGVQADLPFELIAIAVVFPTAFSIAAAHRRREESLEALASIRAAIVGIFYAHRDWIVDNSGHVERVTAVSGRLYGAICAALAATAPERDGKRQAVSNGFSDLSRSIETLKRAGVQGSEISRANQFLYNAIKDFERLRTIADYRTSDSMRTFSKLFLNVLPVLFAPFYAHVAHEAGHPLFGYGVALAFALVLVGLDNVQDGLEDPFDGIGADDVRLDVSGELFWLRTTEPAPGGDAEAVELR
jgi:hypothetical protein